MNKLKDIQHDELIKMFHELKDYLEYLEAAKKKLEEQNVRKSTKTN